MVNRPEHKLQCSVIDYLDAFGRPDLFWFAVPNGDFRHVNTALRLKAEGVKPGVADICILKPYGRCAWLELKAKRGSLSDHQVGFATRCTNLGHDWGTAKTLDEAVELLVLWSILKPEVIAKLGMVR